MSGPEVPVIQVVSAVSVPAPQRVLLKSKSWNNSTKPGTGKTTHGLCPTVTDKTWDLRNPSVS